MVVVGTGVVAVGVVVVAVGVVVVAVGVGVGLLIPGQLMSCKIPRVIGPGLWIDSPLARE